MEEEWKQCGESKLCIYFVSNQGRVKSMYKKCKKENIVKGNVDKDGYIKVQINRKPFFIHQLVLLYFKGMKPEGMVIDHINRIRNDNRIENLRYCTQQDNRRNSSTYRIDILEEDLNKRNKIINRECTKRYYKKNKEKIYNCECGSTFLKFHKSRHERTKKHQNYILSLNK